MRRVTGMDIHRTFAEVVVFWEEGKLHPAGRISMTRAGLEGFGRSLGKEDEVVIEATGNAMAVVRVLAPYVARVLGANPLQVKAIAHAHVTPDKIDAGVLASLRAANFLPYIWLPDPDGVARRNGIRTARGSRRDIDPACPSDPAVPACRRVRGDWAGSGWHDRSSPMTSVPPSNGTCASSIGWARIWGASTQRSHGRRSRSRQSSGCSRSPAST